MKTFLESIQKQLKLRFVATTPQERAQGLMHQEPLAPDEGALFSFDKPIITSFWNKNVSFPIEIGFFDLSKKLIEIRRLNANQEQEIRSKGEVAYALEAPIGFFTKKDIGKSLEQLIKE